MEKKPQYHFIAQGEMSMDSRTFTAGQGWLVPANTPRYELTPGKAWNSSRFSSANQRDSKFSDASSRV